MTLRRLADVFMGAGLALGAVAVLGYAFDVVPDLPPELFKLVLYKLVGIGALGLIVFGALLGRLHRRMTHGPEQMPAAASLPPESPPDFIDAQRSAREARPEYRD